MCTDIKQKERKKECVIERKRRIERERKGNIFGRKKMPMR